MRYKGETETELSRNSTVDTSLMQMHHVNSTQYIFLACQVKGAHDQNLMSLQDNVSNKRLTDIPRETIVIYTDRYGEPRRR